MKIDAPKNKRRAPLRPLNAPTLALTCLGLGFLRPAPGTWGSMPPPAVVFVLAVAGSPPTLMLAAVAAMLLVSCVTCVAWGRYAESRFGAKDAAEVVIDETAGVCMPLFGLWIVPGLTEPDFSQRAVWSAGFCVASFVAFRAFDILKPWPARELERYPAGWGVLADDLAAGLYAAGIVVLGALLTN